MDKGNDINFINNTDKISEAEFNELMKEMMEEIGIPEELREKQLKAIIKDKKRVKKKIENRNGKKDLNSLIDDLNKEEIKNILRNLNIKFNSSDKKSDLMIKLNMNYKDAVRDFIVDVSSSLYDSFNEIKNKNGMLTVADYENVNMSLEIEESGLLFYSLGKNGELKAVVPVEAMDILKDLDNIVDKDRVNHEREVIKIFKGMLYYYGILHIGEFIMLLKDEYKLKMDIERLNEILIIESIYNLDFDYVNCVGMNYFIEDEELMDAIASNRDANSYKKISIESFKKASKELYIGEESIYKSLVRVIKENYDLPESALDEILEEVYLIAQEGSEELLINTMLEAINPPDYLVDELITALKIVYRRIPLWIESGYNYNEKYGDIKEKAAEVRIGRNELCSCGSGKKYKKCCGSKVISLF